MKVKVNSKLWERFSKLKTKKGDLSKHAEEALRLYFGNLRKSLVFWDSGHSQKFINIEYFNPLENSCYLKPVGSDEFHPTTLKKIVELVLANSPEKYSIDEILDVIEKNQEVSVKLNNGRTVLICRSRVAVF